MLQRLDAMESELGALIESLRTGANRLNADLQLLEGNLDEVREAVAPAAAVRARAPRPQPEPAAACRAGSATDDAAEPLPEAEPPSRGRRRPRRAAADVG